MSFFATSSSKVTHFELYWIARTFIFLYLQKRKFKQVDFLYLLNGKGFLKKLNCVPTITIQGHLTHSRFNFLSWNTYIPIHTFQFKIQSKSDTPWRVHWIHICVSIDKLHNKSLELFWIFVISIQKFWVLS